MSKETFRTKSAENLVLKFNKEFDNILLETQDTENYLESRKFKKKINFVLNHIKLIYFNF